MKVVRDMKHEEYVKFLTEQLVTRMDRTKEDKINRKQHKNPDIISNKWFGLFPLSWRILTKK